MSNNNNSPAVGLDLGSEYVSVAVWNDKKQSAETVTNDVGNRATPVVVAFTEEEALVAEVAVKQAHKNFANTVRYAPALLGQEFSSDAAQALVKSVQFKTQANANGQVEIVVKDGAETYSPQQIVSKVLSKMKQFAEAYINQPTPDVVVAVPLRFSQANKDAVKEAATLAGFEKVTFIAEPTASIIAHGFDKNTNDLSAKKVLVFDFGANSADATVANVQQGLIEILANRSDANVGGVKFNEVLANHLADIFDKKFATNVRSSPKAMAKLLIQAERTKTILSTAQDAHVIMDSLFEGNDLHTKVTRTKLEMIARKIISATRQVVDQALEDAKLHADDIDEVLLVGGSSQIVKISKVMTNQFPNATVHNELCLDSVAQGAALHAAIANGQYGPQPKKNDDVDVKVTQLNLGVAGANGKLAVLIPRGTALPATATETFTTSVDNQSAVFIEVYEGANTAVEQNNLLAQASLAVPAKAAGQAHVQVTFSLSENGSLTVTGVCAGKDVKVSIAHNDGTNSDKQAQCLDAQKQKDAAKFAGTYEDSDAEEEADDDEYEPPVELDDDDEDFDLGEDDLD